MNDFIKRNVPVFAIGLVTVVVFLIIIVVAQKNPGSGPALERIQKEDFLTEGAATKGNINSKVVLVEFSDFECPACKEMHPIVSALVEKYKDHMLFVYKNYPLPQHKNSKLAAIAFQAAGNQGNYWPYADKLFDNQTNLSRENLIKLAEDTGLNKEMFVRDMDDPKFATQVENDRTQGNRIGINSTPTFILNNRLLNLTAAESLETELVAEFAKTGVDIQSLNPPKEDIVEQTSETTQSSETRTEEQLAFDNRYGIIEIEYNEFGFRPNNVKALVGQLVRWTNATKKDIQIQQLIQVYPEFAQQMTLKPGQTFEMRLTKDKLWTFKEVSHRHYGSIFAVAP